MPEPSQTPPARSRTFPASGAAVLLAAVAVGALIAQHAAAAPQVTVRNTGTNQPNSDGITVTGTGHVLGTPDLLTVTAGVESQAAHVSDALNDADSRMNRLIGAFSSAGVAAKDIQTQSASINQIYDGSGHVNGYGVSETVIVRLHDLSKAGATLDSAANAAGDSARLEGMQLSISDGSSLLADARKQAMDDARTKAEQFASAGGARLGQLRSVNATTSPPDYQLPNAYGSMAAASKLAMPVSPGQQAVDVIVTTVWDLTP